MQVLQEDLESLIRRYIILGKRSAKGFETVKCARCNDYKVRGGFRFDGEAVGFYCFNCGTKHLYDPTVERELSKSFKETLIAFGVPEDELTRVNRLEYFKRRIGSGGKISTEKKVASLPTHAIEFPEGAVPVSSKLSPWCEVAEIYLRSRGLDPISLPYHVTDHEKYAGRVIIPYYFRNKLIYWQGRSLDPSIEPRYKNPIVSVDNVFFNMDEVYRYSSSPLLVTEGPTDALSIGSHAVSLTGSVLTEFKSKALEIASTRRKVIFVIDKNLNGLKLGEQALSDETREFYVAIYPENIDDSNDALLKMGRIWIAKHLSSTAVKGFQGRMLLRLNSK